MIPPPLRPAKPITLGSHVWLWPAAVALAGVIVISVGLLK